MNCEPGNDVCTLPRIKQATNERACCAAQGNFTQCSVGTQMGRTFKNQGTYANIQLVHLAVQQKLTQLCKATTFQLKQFFKGHQFWNQMVWVQIPNAPLNT